MARGRCPQPWGCRLRLLADTHAALWWLSDDERLSDAAREAIAGAEEWTEELLAEGFALLPISVAHAAAYRHLPYVEVGGRRQRDPFDRLLVAQAMTEQVPLVTCDPGIVAHGVATIW